MTVYSASAGSGKTWALTRIFLTALFVSRYAYRRILAVTFTHKATAEMKNRILESLSRLSGGEDSDYLAYLIEKTGKNEDEIRTEAGIILSSILHDYSRFSVSTIDSFFQKILRAFTHEAGLHTGYSVQLEHELILSAAVDDMIRSSAGDPVLKEWLREFAMINVQEEKSWDLKSEILNLAGELFREKFRILSADQRDKLADKQFLIDYIAGLRKLSSGFIEETVRQSGIALGIMSRHQLADDMFYHRGSGVPGFIKANARGNLKTPNTYVREAVSVPAKWCTGKMTPALASALEDGLAESVGDLVKYFDANYVRYMSASSILSGIYSLGILTDVLAKIRDITAEENTFLLSDAGEFLSLITSGGQVPFIYEKTGNRYDTYMIDEFQDTSELQWRNFRPLIENSMAEGNDNLVVGDIKQSIYRWRNSDWKILGNELENLIDDDRFIKRELDINHRSSANIIAFNNYLFARLPAAADKKLGETGDNGTISSLYKGALQKDPGRRGGGYVRIEYVSAEEEDGWEDIVLSRLPGFIGSLFDKGYRASDIGIIVRDSREGALVVSSLSGTGQDGGEPERERNAFNVVSDDSLLLSSSPAINFIISVFAVVENPSDEVSMAKMIRFYMLATGDDRDPDVNLYADSLAETSGSVFPDGYSDLIGSLKNLALYEASEKIIGFFRLGEYENNIAFLDTFQDNLLEFSGTRYTGLASFLDWWENTGSGKSVVMPGNQDAIRVLTIHKSKGLEFRVVIVPFISWTLDHKQGKYPYLWVRPSTEPFSDLGIVPVKYGKDLLDTIFAGDYLAEKHSAFLDNINLLYVAFTRARDVLAAFAVTGKRFDNFIPGILKEALGGAGIKPGNDTNDLSRFYDAGRMLFEYGSIPEQVKNEYTPTESHRAEYSVLSLPGRLRLKLHGENYFSSSSAEVRRRINYGNLMHEIFASISFSSDVEGAVLKLVLEGKLPEDESENLKQRINTLLSAPPASGWFSPGNEILTETGIIVPGSTEKRPDRVILNDGKATVIDFKFGSENPGHLVQVKEYMHFVANMNYTEVSGFLWYVDLNKIIAVE